MMSKHSGNPGSSPGTTSELFFLLVYVVSVCSAALGWCAPNRGVSCTESLRHCSSTLNSIF